MMTAKASCLQALCQRYALSDTHEMPLEAPVETTMSSSMAWPSCRHVAQVPPGPNVGRAGQIKLVHAENFMCHKNFDVDFG